MRNTREYFLWTLTLDQCLFKLLLKENHFSFNVYVLDLHLPWEGSEKTSEECKIDQEQYGK